MASVFAIEWCIRALIPQYDPSGHVEFITKQDGLVIAKERGHLRQIKNTGDYNVEIYISDLGLREPKNLKRQSPQMFLSLEIHLVLVGVSKRKTGFLIN